MGYVVKWDLRKYTPEEFIAAWNEADSMLDLCS